MQLLLSIAGLHLLACLSPGPDIFLVALNSLRKGWRAGVQTTLGILTGVSLHIFLGITGISLLLTQSEGASRMVALLGGIWLVYIGLAGLRNGLRNHHDRGARPADVKGPEKETSPFLQGLLVNLLNVKALLFFLSLFSILLGPEVPLRMRIFAGLVMITVQGVAFSLVAYLVTRAPLRSKWNRLQNGFEIAISVLLLALGCWIWIQSLHSVFR